MKRTTWEEYNNTVKKAFLGKRSPFYDALKSAKRILEENIVKRYDINYKELIRLLWDQVQL